MTDIKPIYSQSGDAPLLIAGPCSAESREQTLTTASLLAEIGVKIFRAGVWKPRTKPGGFEGVGSIALGWLKEVKDKTGMATATEIATPSHLHEALEADVDIFWIGARTTANPFAVQLIADALAQYPESRRDRMAVLVKNPINADIELWIGAMERIYNAGIRKLGAIHRGFSSYGPHIFRNPPIWKIPLEFHRRLPEVTLLCDPSHIGGKRELVLPLAHKALNMNFDGLIIESHCSPESALSDMHQQLLPNDLTPLMHSLSTPRNRNFSTNTIETLRRTIDDIDDKLIETLAKRMEVAREIGKLKRVNDIPVVQKDRYNELITRHTASAENAGLNPDFVLRLLAEIHEESVRQQIEINETE